MSELYIYNNETNEHVATVVGDWQNDRDAVSAAEDAGYCTNDYSNTSSPAFGFSGGLVENPDAETIEYSEIKRAAASLGKLGGSKTSPRKSQTSRENGKKGGRPRKVKSVETN